MNEEINLDEIIGDSKGQEAAKKIHEWITKNCKYEYYKPEFKPEFGGLAFFDSWSCKELDTTELN